MIIGMLILVFWNRSRVKKQPGAFPVKVRLEADPGFEKEAKWPRMAGYAQWIHDVLIVRTGLGLMLATPYGINAMEGPVQDADPEEVKGLGEYPKVIRARLDDGSILQVAVGELHPELAPDHFQTGQRQEQLLDGQN
jgi:hypothetical protein